VSTSSTWLVISSADGVHSLLLHWTAVPKIAQLIFIGVAEILGAIGLILPAITGIAPWLTVTAAAGLVVVMVSASTFHASRREYSNIGMNVVLLLLAVLVIVGRLTFAPLA
jgi:putative oxidoreductase